MNENLLNAHVALFNTDTEVTALSYKRQSSTFTSASGGQVSNNEDILFPIAGETWGEITHIGVFDSLENGNLLFKAPAEFIKSIDISSQYKIPKNYLILRLK